MWEGIDGIKELVRRTGSPVGPSLEAAERKIKTKLNLILNNSSQSVWCGYRPHQLLFMLRTSDRSKVLFHVKQLLETAFLWNTDAIGYWCLDTQTRAHHLQIRARIFSQIEFEKQIGICLLSICSSLRRFPQSLRMSEVHYWSSSHF